MQISKTLSIVCAAAVIVPVTALAADNPAQAKARQALEQMYQSGGPRTAPAVEQPKPSSTRPAAIRQSPMPGTAVTPADSDTIAKARAAVRSRMAEMEGGAVESSLGSPNAVSADKIEESRAAMRKQMDTVIQREQAAEANQQAAKTAPGPLKGVGQYDPLEGPAVPFSQDKQAKLADLLRKYRADEITPEQYHAERAKIISGK